MILPICDENHRYWLGNKHVVSVTQVMQSAGIIDTKFYTVEARERGTVVHKCIHYLNQNDLDIASIDESVRGYISAYRAFLEISRLTIRMAETVVYSPKHEYCGTLDIAGVMRGRSVIIDVKTGHAPAWVGIQLAAYKNALLECGGPRCSRYSLELRNDGNFKLREHKDIDDFANFKAALERVKHANSTRESDRVSQRNTNDITAADKH